MEATKEELEAQKGNGEGKEEETTPVEGANAAKNRKKRERAKAKKAAEEAGENLDKMAGKIDEEENKQSEPKGVDNDDKNEGEGEGDAEKKKKKKKKKSPKEYAPREQDNSHIRLLGSWSPGDWKQTVDYSIPVSKQFPDNKFPKGLRMEYE